MSKLVRFSILFAFLITSLTVYGQQLTFPTDVTGNSIGYAMTAWTGNATASANPASLGHTQQLQVSAAVRSRFLVEGLFDYGLFGSFTLDDKSSVGIQVEHFSFEQFRQQTFAGSYGRKLSDKVSLGIRFSYLLIAQEEQESASAVSGGVGILYKINDEVSIGAEVNPFSSGFDNEVTFPLARKVGFSYRPSEIVSVNGDISYVSNLPNNISVGVGVTYDIFETVNLALGYRSNPDTFSFGIGWQVSDGLMINLSSSFHQRLGASPIGGFIYRQ